MFNFKFRKLFKLLKTKFKKKLKFIFRKRVKLLNKYNIRRLKYFFIFKKFLNNNKILLFKKKVKILKKKKYLFFLFYKNRRNFINLNILKKKKNLKNIIKKRVVNIPNYLNFLKNELVDFDENLFFSKLKYSNILDQNLLVDNNFEYNQLNNLNIIINKFNYLFFVGLIQMINYNTTFKQYSLDIYTGFKFDFSLLFFKSFFFTPRSYNLFKTFYLFLNKFFKPILNNFKKKLKQFIFLSNIKPKIKIFKKLDFNFSIRFQELNIFHLSNSFVNRYIFLFSKLFLLQYKNAFSVFSWRNIKNYSIINNYKIFKYLKLKKMNNNLKIFISIFYNQIKINFSFKRIIFLIKILKKKKFLFNIIYLFILKFLILKLFNKLCHNLIN